MLDFLWADCLKRLTLSGIIRQNRSLAILFCSDQVQPNAADLALRLFEARSQGIFFALFSL
jgi:hypothetical protein